MARAWYTKVEGRFWRFAPDAAGGEEPPRGDDDLIPVYGDRNSLEPQFGFDKVALYERQVGTTNVRRGTNAPSIAKDWRYSRDRERFVWLIGPKTSLIEELTALEVNEIAGREVISVGSPITAAGREV